MDWVYIQLFIQVGKQDKGSRDPASRSQTRFFLHIIYSLEISINIVLRIITLFTVNTTLLLTYREDIFSPKSQNFPNSFISTDKENIFSSKSRFPKKTFFLRNSKFSKNSFSQNPRSDSRSAPQSLENFVNDTNCEIGGGEAKRNHLGLEVKPFILQELLRLKQNS